MTERVCRGCGKTFEDKTTGRGNYRRYCSTTCRWRAHRQRTKELAATRPACEVGGCEKPTRNGGARWCEAHYIRWYRHGDPAAWASTAKQPDGHCIHCGADAPSKSLYCSPLCRTRVRIGAENITRFCVVCGTELPFHDRPNKLYCSTACTQTAGRARRYGITIEEFQRRRETQRGRCACCGDETAELFIDHCHRAGGVRGLLCTQCNVGLGMFRDDPVRLTAAIRYIRTPAAL